MRGAKRIDVLFGSTITTIYKGNTDIDNSDSTEANLRVLYPLDRFGLSDKFYQELSMLFSELPRSNAVKRNAHRTYDILDLIRIEGYKGNHTIAVVKADSFVNVNGNPYPIELFLSSDMKHGSMKQFSCQGVEKHNDDAKRNYFSSNQWDAPAEDRVQAGRAA
eukprot:Em0005g1365a